MTGIIISVKRNTLTVLFTNFFIIAPVSANTGALLTLWLIIRPLHDLPKINLAVSVIPHGFSFQAAPFVQLLFLLF